MNVHSDLGYYDVGDIPTICPSEHVPPELQKSAALHEQAHQHLAHATTLGLYDLTLLRLQRMAAKRDLSPEAAYIAAVIEQVHGVFVETTRVVHEGFATWFQLHSVIADTNDVDTAHSIHDILDPFAYFAFDIFTRIAHTMPPIEAPFQAMVDCMYSVASAAMNPPLFEVTPEVSAFSLGALPMLLESPKYNSHHRIVQILRMLEAGGGKELHARIAAYLSEWDEHETDEFTTSLHRWFAESVPLDFDSAYGDAELFADRTTTLLRSGCEMLEIDPDEIDLRPIVMPRHDRHRVSFEHLERVVSPKIQTSEELVVWAGTATGEPRGLVGWLFPLSQSFTTWGIELVFVPENDQPASRTLEGVSFAAALDILLASNAVIVLLPPQLRPTAPYRDALLAAPGRKFVFYHATDVQQLVRDAVEHLGTDIRSLFVGFDGFHSLLVAAPDRSSMRFMAFVADGMFAAAVAQHQTLGLEPWPITAVEIADTRAATWLCSRGSIGAFRLR